MNAKHKRMVGGAVIGTLVAVFAMFYVALVTAVRGPVDWPSLVQVTLIFGPFFTVVGAVVGAES